MSNAEQTEAELDELVELFSEYHEGGLDPEAARALETRIKEEPKVAEAYKDFERTMEALSGMHKMSAPEDFDRKVEETIHRRSGGRFFGRKAFGDRIPYELLAVIVLLVALGVYWLGRSSGTGGHKLQRDNKPEIHKDAKDVIPSL